MKSPWSHEELCALSERIERDIRRTEEENPDIRPLPPLSEEEAKNLILDLTAVAVQRQLTHDESFLIGQLLSGYRMAVEARMLKKPGRYFVLSEADIQRLMNEQ